MRSATLESAALPRRVHSALEHLYALVSEELERQLERMLSDFEQQLLRLAEQSRNNSLQAHYFENVRCIRQNRADLVPRYLNDLEAALTRIRDPLPMRPGAHELAPNFEELRLLDDSEVSEQGVLHSIALRHDSRASLPLMLLGQRFGVLAGAPAFDTERLPVGPQSLGRILADSSRVLDVDHEARLLLFRCFDTHVMASYAQLVETMNALLARDNVLPGLSYVPLRVRPSAQNASRDGNAREDRARDARANEDSARTGNQRGKRGETRPASAEERAAANRHAQRPHTAWPGETDASDSSEDENIAFSLLQQLLTSRSDLLGRFRAEGSANARLPLPTADVVAALESQQGETLQRSQGPRTLPDIKQTLLAQSRQQHGHAANLAREDNDTFELLGMMYAEIGKELREGAASSALLGRLQVPLVRVALQDRGFFVRSHHPARQLLNTVAEAGANWLAEDEADPQLDAQLHQAVDHVVENYHGDAHVFEVANESLQSHLHTMARKAEVTERRHVEAARGKEKLALAKRHAAEAIEQVTRGQRLPKFVSTLLSQAWSDVLTLTLLRHGETSEEWQRQLEATTQIIAASAGIAPAPHGLEQRIDDALTLVGYHADEATAIARRLTVGRDQADEDPASRTELAMKLKARARLGDDTPPVESKSPPRTPDEQARYDYLRTLPFGTWIEFVKNQQGDVIRRRLAWFSPITDQALFVNQRGQRVDEQSLDSLSRLLASQQARVVTAQRGRLVDRAWHAALNALRSFTGRGPTGEASA
ncbi:MAG: DUF1631 domain-containing protein [Pseudomonadota bacterium]|nr:DUF1631 domain-containing protein [Pseudomonadota bacterium]